MCKELVTRKLDLQLKMSKHNSLQRVTLRAHRGVGREEGIPLVSPFLL